MVLGLTSAEIKQLLDRERLEELLDKYDERHSGLPQLSATLTLRDLITELILENNKRIESQLSSAGITIS